MIIRMQFQSTLIDFSTSHFREFNPRQPFISTFPSLPVTGGDKFDLSDIEELRETLEKTINDIIQPSTSIKVKSYISPFSLPKPNFTLATVTKWKPILRSLSEAERALFIDGDAPQDTLSFTCHAPFLCFTLENSSEFNLPIFNITTGDGNKGLAVNLPIIRVYIPQTREVTDDDFARSSKGKEEDMESCD